MLHIYKANNIYNAADTLYNNKQRKQSTQNKISNHFSHACKLANTYKRIEQLQYCMTILFAVSGPTLWSCVIHCHRPFVNDSSLTLRILKTVLFSKA